MYKIFKLVDNTLRTLFFPSWNWLNYDAQQYENKVKQKMYEAPILFDFSFSFLRSIDVIDHFSSKIVTWSRYLANMAQFQANLTKKCLLARTSIGEIN